MRKGQYEAALQRICTECYDDPLGFVMAIFPWGQEGTDLVDQSGPDDWQRDQLTRVGEKFRSDPDTTIQEAIASGHGIGKSAETAWIVIWAMSTRAHLTGVVTANAKHQLESKTWRELAVWHKRALNKHWFEWTATKFFQKEHPETWFVSAIPNNENNSESFAGLHGDHVLIIYDESSAIPDIIWEVSEGAMTTPRAMWFVFGNPTRNTGRFRECFGKNRHRWSHHSIDSRTCKMTNKKKLEEWKQDYGEDSDFFRVRVKGEFPKAGVDQFISTDVVEECRRRVLDSHTYFHMPVVIGVDVARFGDDQSVIIVRQGRKILSIKKYREQSTVELSHKVLLHMKDFPAKAIFVDGIGIGAGVVDYLRSLGHQVFDVVSSAKPYDPVVYFNKRAEMWGAMRDWLSSGADIGGDSELRDDLVAVEYSYTPKGQIRLEKKEDLKSRGLASPDCGDALAMTFAEQVSSDFAGAGSHHNSFEPEYT